jgi:16S rRNA (adenine1518-N6/adenine1519-N6)-dimethyltransferase
MTMQAVPSLPALPVPALLRQHNLRPDRRLGQNFLIDDHALRKVVAAAGLQPEMNVLEVGAGLGSLTRYLAIQSGQVVAVELDQRLLPILHSVLRPYGNVSIVAGDILKLDLADLMDEKPYQVVANIPYYITSAVIRHLLEAQKKPQGLVLTVQKEVAERICAGPGEMSLLALSVQVYGRPEVAGRIPAGAFYPVPKVDSAVVRVNLLGEPLIPIAMLDLFFQLARAGFGQKRKTLRNALAGGLHWKPAQAEALLVAAGINPMRRAETLLVVEWERLTRQLYEQQAQA